MASKKKSKKYDFVGKIKKNPWKVTTFVFAILSLILIGSMVFNAGTLSSKQAGENFVDYINSMGATQIEYIDSSDFSEGLYQVTISAEGKEIPVHVTKDGLYYVQGVMPITQQVVVEEKPAPVTGEIIKSDEPLVQLFVMTHCPYGTQAEKGFIPTMKALSEVADLEIRFVHYYMHTNNQEEVETPRQVCIREEQTDKFIPYLECFLGKTGTQDDAAACELEIGIDSSALAECIESGRAEEYYAEDSVLSEAAGVRGSPTLVVNGQIVNSGRNPQAYGDVVCQSFNNVPELCGTISLDSTNPSPGFGYSATGSATTAQC